MIDSLHGMIVVKTPEEVVVECGGVGYFLKITPQTAGILPAVGEKGFLYAHMQFSENDVSLYGFENTRQREMFRLLIGVSGVSSGNCLMSSHCGMPQIYTSLTIQRSSPACRQR